MLRLLQPSHQHSALSATLLLMGSVMLARVIGYLREMYVAWAFGAGPTTDAYVAAFQIPDYLFYLLAGGTTSITFISIYTRHTSRGEEEKAQEAFNTTVTIMSVIALAGTVLVEWFTPQIARLIFPKFNPDQMALCVYLTRIILPGQIFFYAGGIVSAVLLSKRMFLYPALSPVLYGSSIIVGGLIGAQRFGIAALAYGALAGSFIGPFLINSIGAAKTGLQYRWSIDFRNREFHEWVKLSIPLMLGVSLVSADDWILRYFASGGAGEISRLNYAKRLFALPISILGQAAGQASMPFFARLFGEGKRAEFAESVNQSVYRVGSAALLGSALMLPAALPLVDLAFRRGHFTVQDSVATAAFFAWFSLSLALWSAQALYARAFYATGDTLTPMVASTLIVIASLPMYAAMFHRFGFTGLAMASDVGILLHTVVMAWLLNRNGLVGLSGLPWGEVAKALATGVVAGLAGYAVAGRVVAPGEWRRDVVALAAIGLTWLAVLAAGLWFTRSKLWSDLRRGKRPSAMGEPQAVVERTEGGVQP
ncbi:MAG TPA: murein biosynthesis integral membrane protein MurJ [Candidatus Eisenbacteria bacterium]|nr:murein biosynthesis integral membrane protein MurJ [Candidatus Eisenbacteria bacterium]